MKADIILFIEHGVVKHQHIVQDPITAEAIFNGICGHYMAEDYKHVMTAVDYGQRLGDAKRYLNPMGVEVIWSEQVKIKRYKNKYI